MKNKLKWKNLQEQTEATDWYDYYSQQTEISHERQKGETVHNKVMSQS